MRTGLPAALLRGTPSAIRDDRFTRCPFPAATTHAPVALARNSNTAMEHRNRCTDLRHPELLATSLLKCPRQVCCETPSETKKIGKLSPLSSFIFFDPTGFGFDHRYRTHSQPKSDVRVQSLKLHGRARIGGGSARRTCDRSQEGIIRTAHSRPAAAASGYTVCRAL